MAAVIFTGRLASHSEDNATKRDPTAEGVWVCLHEASRKTQLSLAHFYSYQLLPYPSQLFNTEEECTILYINVSFNLPCFVYREISDAWKLVCLTSTHKYIRISQAVKHVFVSPFTFSHRSDTNYNRFSFLSSPTAPHL